MKILAWAIASSIALAGMSYYNTQLAVENASLKTQLSTVKATVVQVEKEVIRFIRADTSIPSSTRERLIEVVKDGNRRIYTSLARIPKPPTEQRFGLQTGYNGRRWVGGLDYQLVRRGRWSLNPGVAGNKRFLGPTVGLMFRPSKQTNLTFGGIVLYNVSSKKIESFMGVRLPI